MGRRFGSAGFGGAGGGRIGEKECVVVICGIGG